MPEDSAADQGQATPRSRNLWGVWPTELREEWHQRTTYGKFRYLVMLPTYVAGWAVFLMLAVIMAVGYYGLVLAWRAHLKMSEWRPATHRDGGECNGE